MKPWLEPGKEKRQGPLQGSPAFDANNAAIFAPSLFLHVHVDNDVPPSFFLIEPFAHQRVRLQIRTLSQPSFTNRGDTRIHWKTDKYYAIIDPLF
jgi:hypothetical protein